VDPPTARDGDPAGLPDLVAPGLRVLFCGINPGLRSAERGLHFAGTSNRFWKVLHGAAFTDRQWRPEEQHALPSVGLGITNLVARPTATAAELSRDELRRGAADLERRVASLDPRIVAFVGLGAYRSAFGRPRAGVGRQPERLGSSTVWLLPNPSGLQARYQLPELVTLYAEVARAAGPGPPGRAVAAGPP
jgi:TDG/mug DNA glycosylase family protein